MSANDVAAPAWFRWALSNPGASHRVRAGGIELHYLGWSLDDAAKPPLLLVHGHRAHARWWDHVAPFLATTHRVFAMDLSGMGDSDRRAVYPRGVGGQDIVDLVSALGLGPVAVVGHSNGGLRALSACARAPELFQRVIAIDSYAVFKGGRHPAEPASLRGDRIYPDLAAAMSRYRLLPEQPHAEPWVRDHIARHSLREAPGGWTWKFDPLMPSGPAQEDDGDELLAAVTCPVHYVYGTESVIVSEPLAQRIVRTLPQGRGPIAIPGGHHHLMFDQPGALIATLRALLA